MRREPMGYPALTFAPDQRRQDMASPDEQDQSKRERSEAGSGEGQVSEVAAMGSEEEAGTPIAPGDATAGYPESESGDPEEGTAGPDAPPRHGKPEPSNESSR
jgi:hypothetical protein